MLSRPVRVSVLAALIVIALVPARPAAADPGDEDWSFNGGGAVSTDVYPDADTFSDVVQQPEGGFVAVGHTGSWANENILIGRFDPSGAPSLLFRNVGYVTADLGSNGEQLRAVAIQTN